MNTETETLVAVLRDRLSEMTPENRLELVRELTQDFCLSCGCEPSGSHCYCTAREGFYRGLT